MKKAFLLFCVLIVLPAALRAQTKDDRDERL